MKIKVLKPYWIIGSLITAGIMITIGYNIIVASTEKEVWNVTNFTEELSKDEYSNDVTELKQRVMDIESKMNALEERVATLENSNDEKNGKISSLQSKINVLKNKIAIKIRK